MSPLLNIGQVIKGKTKYLHHQQTIIRLRFPSTPAYQTPKSNSKAQNVIIESIRGHWRLKNEADILKHFQSKTSISSFRPLIDEIIEPADPPSIVLRYLDNDLLSESYKKTLTRSELKFVARRVLQALQVLHHDGFVHTDVKPDNILVNHGKGNERFSEVQLADFGGTVSVESKWAKEGHIVGTYKWRSPEVLLGMPWGTSSDIWSFGCSILMLIYGDHYPLNPKSGGVEVSR
ncbi:0de4f0dd-a22d-4b7f-aa87-5fbb38e7203a [Sclerotinia trifoliorum]|uniref:non-specific serine/threonine protein kinase n=1 Tax=Sclerotinia trifoliorum TaxID=28548 RepID=A0A8H2VT83_9HELO|nr:0de4f0dd-a22d-4b7f-aa87-5fbb38e7203a [Sclerotinia trifoliorum]